LPDAGEFKQCDLWNNEAILFGDSVNYMPPQAIERMLQRAIEDEFFDGWKSNGRDYVCPRISAFTRKIWFVHPFSEGTSSP
jgi:fido (protein-threonine AMPylation protein)